MAAVVWVRFTSATPPGVTVVVDALCWAWTSVDVRPKMVASEIDTSPTCAAELGGGVEHAARASPTATSADTSLRRRSDDTRLPLIPATGVHGPVQPATARGQSQPRIEVSRAPRVSSRSRRGDEPYSFTTAEPWSSASMPASTRRSIVLEVCTVYGKYTTSTPTAAKSRSSLSPLGVPRQSSPL